MATYYARKAGNINAADVWATAPAGTASAVTFAAGDVLMANSFAITVNVSTNLGATGEVRTDTTGGATAGGGFTLSNGVTLTANCYAGTSDCVTFSLATGNSAFVVGNCFAGTGTAASGARNSSSGTLNVTGSATAGIHNNGNPHGVANTGTGVLNLTGNVVGGSNISRGAFNNGAGVLYITGTVLGGTSTHGAFNNGTGTMVIDGTVQASESMPGVGGTSPQQITLMTGPFLISPINGVNPIGCTAWRWASALNNHTYIEVGTQTLLEKRNLVTPDNATNFPAASDVRSGTPYGIGGVVFGTCAVPSPAAVAMGTPVDDTVGTLTISVPTASEIATAVWGASTKTITGGVVDTLTNAPTVPTPSQIASQVRTELSTELSRLDVATSTRSTLATGDLPSVPSAASVASAVRTELTELSNLDASVSSRLAGSAYTAPSTPPTAADIASAVWAAADKTGYSLTSAERSAIAAAVESSILNEGDGQAVLNAIVGAIGNSNVDQIALVAAIRADLERTGGKLINLDATISSRLASADYTAPTAAPTAAQNASAVRTELSTELARIDAPISGATAPSAATVASAVRTELSTELGRVDAAVSTRATPANVPTSDITAIKTRLDSINVERVNNTATTNIVGTLLAQSQS